uniref:Uncharacterized protein n=1 Tax=Eutreptiella gymnastica TaxID=73025 RepID=A0A7S4D1T6_9EUGL
MHLDDLLASKNQPVEPGQPSVPEENWEVPITGSILNASHASCFEAQHAAANEEDSYEVPMVPLGSVCNGAPPHTFPPPVEAETNHHGLIRDCQAVPGLARVNGRSPFQMWQGLPLQHYSMRPNQQMPRAHAGHGQATMEQT